MTRIHKNNLLMRVSSFLACSVLVLCFVPMQSLAEEALAQAGKNEPVVAGKADSDKADVELQDGGMEVINQGELIETDMVSVSTEDKDAVQTVNNHAEQDAISLTQSSDGVTITPQSDVPSVNYRVHVQTMGDQTLVADGAVAGTSGQAKRLEAVWLSLDKSSAVQGGIEYRTHVQTYGWQGWVANGAKSGTSGQAKRLEAIQIRLSGKLAQDYDVWYRVHAQRVGWMAWTRNGEVAGTSGLALRLEAIQVLIMPKGAPQLGDVAGVHSAVGVAALEKPEFSYHAHVQTYGWQGWVQNGAMAGTYGMGKRLEALEVKYACGLIPGGIRYQTHVQRDGWQGWVADGAMSGTQGEAKCLEAIRIELTGEVSRYFDVWYRTHIQTHGWLGWTRNGEASGSEGMARRMEALEIQILPKGSPAPGSTAGAFRVFTTSGDAEFDSILRDIIHMKTGIENDALQRGFTYVTALEYAKDPVRYGNNDWQSWSVPLAKEMYRTGAGNCYRYAALITWIARALGYDANVRTGEVLTSSGWSVHGWCEVHQNGTTYVVDCERQHFIPNRNFFMTTYDTAPVFYR